MNHATVRTSLATFAPMLMADVNIAYILSVSALFKCRSVNISELSQLINYIS